MDVINREIKALIFSFNTMKSSRNTADITINNRKGVDIPFRLVFGHKVRI